MVGSDCELGLWNLVLWVLYVRGLTMVWACWGCLDFSFVGLVRYII